MNILRVYEIAIGIAELEGRHVGMSFLIAIKGSLIAFAVMLVLSFLSMGFLGAALYYACYPVLALFYGNPNNWSGDWVWPAVIAAGMLWSVSFLAAGRLNLYLTPSVCSRVQDHLCRGSLGERGAGLAVHSRHLL